VEVADQRGFILGVSQEQVNFQVPAVAMGQNADIRVITNCDTPDEMRSAPVSVWVQEASPEFLFWKLNADGKNPVYAVNADTGAYVGPENPISATAMSPAKPGDIVTIFGISFGPTDPAIPPGQPAPGDAPMVAPAAVTLGPLTLDAADVLSLGAVPGAFGWYGMKIRVPSLDPGNYALRLEFGIYKTPPGAFLAIGK
jgi:uncharacterized protein (TIGR03437 family)